MRYEVICYDLVKMQKMESPYTEICYTGYSEKEAEETFKQKKDALFGTPYAAEKRKLAIIKSFDYREYMKQHTNLASYRITISHIYSGLLDYWGGNGDRWENNAGCLFCHYTSKTTYKEAVETFFEDYLMGGDCDSFPDDIPDDMIKTALEHQLGNNEKIIDPAKYLDEADDDEDDYESPVWIILVAVKKLTE